MPREAVLVAAIFKYDDVEEFVAVVVVVAVDDEEEGNLGGPVAPLQVFLPKVVEATFVTRSRWLALLPFPE